jgi:hypothetical protein
MKNFPVNFNSETVTVEKYWLGMTSRVSRQILYDLARKHQDHVLRRGIISTELSPILDEMFIYLRTYLFKSMQEEKVILTVINPATWFDHLKHDMLASGKAWQIWLVKTFSPEVKMKTETKECKVVRVCPHDDSYWSESTQHIQFIMWKNDNFGGHYDAP